MSIRPRLRLCDSPHELGECHDEADRVGAGHGHRPVAASAGELGYSYIEVSYSRRQHHGDGSGPVISVSTGSSCAARSSSPRKSTCSHGSGSVTNDDFGTDIDFNEQQLGAGYRHGLCERADFIAELGYINQEVEAFDAFRHASCRP